MGAIEVFCRRLLLLALLVVATTVLALAQPTSAMAAITFSSPRQVTDTPAVYEVLAHDAWSPDGTRLLFSGEDGGGSSDYIAIAGIDSLSYHVLRNWPSSDKPLAWSPDGQLFTFYTGWNGNQIMYMGSDPMGGPLETIVRTQGETWGGRNMYGGQWMPDGQSIVYGDHVGGWFNIMTAPVSGGTPRSIAPASSWPSLSPDGTRVAFIGLDQRGYVMGTAEGPPHSVMIPLGTPGWAPETTPPLWAEDASALAWVEWNPSDPMGPMGTKRVWVANSNGSDQRLLGEFSEARNGISDMQSVSLSRDGSYVAFTALNTATYSRNLFVMSTEGGAPVYSGDVSPMWERPQWSPTSDTIAFQSQSGDLWTVDVSGNPEESTGPAPTLTVSHQPNSSGWYPNEGRPTFTIEAPEGRTAWYRWNDEVWLPVTGPLTGMAGMSTLYYCLDEPDDAETLRSKVILVDGEPPMLDSQWRNRISVDGRESVTITDVNIDNFGGSGFDRVELLANGSVVATSTDPRATLVWTGPVPGVNYDLELRAYDGAGNQASQWTGFGIPAVPIATATVIPDIGESAWHPGMPFVELRGDESEPGGMLLYRWDGVGDWSPYQGFVPPPASDGPHTLEYYQEDWLGEHAVRSVNLRIDSTPPPVPSVVATATSANEVRLDISGAIDTASGLACVEVWEGDTLLASLDPGADTFDHTGLGEDSEHPYRVRAVDNVGHYSEFSETVVVRTPFSAPEPRVPVGTSVHVDLDDVVLDFERVVGAGDVELRTVTSPRGPKPNFRLLPDLYYDIHPTAVFEGSVAVTLRIPLEADVNFDRLRLLHWENGAWQDITTSVDPDARTITGLTSSFSEFSVQEEEPPVVSTPASSPWSLGLTTALMIAALAASLVPRSLRRPSQTSPLHQ